MPANRPGGVADWDTCFASKSSTPQLFTQETSHCALYTATAEARQWLRPDPACCVFMRLHYEVPMSRMPRYAPNDPIFQNTTPDLVARQIISSEQSDDCISKSAKKLTTHRTRVFRRDVNYIIIRIVLICHYCTCGDEMV